MESDFDLLAGLRSGDERAFDALVGRYHPRLIRLAMTFVERREAAEDVAQETWIAVLRGIDRFEGRSPLQSWLFQICVNRARSTASRERRQEPLTGEPPAESPDDHERDRQLVELTHVAIDQLPPMQRQVVTLRDVQGLSSEETCRLLGLTEGNQRVILHRGRAAIRRLLTTTTARASLPRMSLPRMELA